LWLSKDSPVTTAYCAAQNLDHMHKVSTLFTMLLLN